MEGSPNATRQFPDHLLHWKVELLPLSGLTCYKTDNSVNVTEVSQKASFPPYPHPACRLDEFRACPDRAAKWRIAWMHNV